MRLFLLSYLLLFCLAMQAQLPDYSTQLKGQWQLQSVTRSDGNIVYYDWQTSKSLSISPVVWAFNNGIGAILNDTTATPDKMPTDTVEASHYTYSGDTLILNNYYSKGEAETATNAPVVFYQIAKIDNDNLLLILYDTVYGKFRAIDKYSKRYVFRRVLAKEVKVASVTDSLYNKISELDSLLFSAYNSQDMKHFKTYFTTDLEWYQDNGGLINYDRVFSNFQSMFTNENKLTRQLVKGTLEVHPIKGYGAIEIGQHQFKHIENGKLELGTFKFMMIWKNTNGDWKISRVISYDH